MDALATFYLIAICPSFLNQAQKMYKRNFLPLFDIDREKGSQGTKVMIYWSRIVFPKEQWWWCSSLPTAFSYSSSWTHPGSPMIKQSIINHIYGRNGKTFEFSQTREIVCNTTGSQHEELVLEQSQAIILAKVILQHIYSSWSCGVSICLVFIGKDSVICTLTSDIWHKNPLGKTGSIQR